ncbi:AAA family ATPase, partial [Nonomuraea rosea]|uniref:AAA family ATPase n=1 Tax=Nonomuraea rosea TaxID=638574 RepID=UPI0031E6E2F1
MFVGRIAEIALLRAELRAVGGGAARRVVIEGPEGIGKSALIHHTLGGEAGVRVLAASGEESERQLRLGVVRQLAEGAARQLAEGAARQLADSAARELGDRAARQLADDAARQFGDHAVPELADGVGRPLVDGALGEWAGPGLAGLDPCAAGQVLCDVIDRLQAQGPLAVVVDDAQWADRPSLRALGYVLRRIRAGRVLVVIACRDLSDPRADPWAAPQAALPAALPAALQAGAQAESQATLVGPQTGSWTGPWAGSSADAWLPEGLRRLLTGDDTLRITLGGLSAADLAELAGSAGRPGDPPAVTPGADAGGDGTLSALGPGGVAGLAGQVAVRLREHTLGNPLHARALLAGVPLPVLADPGVRLPVPSTYLRLFARRLHTCTPAARQLAAACAVLGGRCPLHLAAAVGTGLGEPLNALEEAVGAGLLRELPGRMIDFPEPLARAAAYDWLGAGGRARLHLTAARLVDDPGTALRHRAAAAGGPDELLADELVGYAAKAVQHGQWQESAAHLDLAAGLTESAARCDELRTAVLEHVLIGGDVLRAAELATARNADPRPVRRYVLGRLALASGRFDEASELLAEAWRHREPGFAADVAEQVAWLRLVTGDRAAAVDWARLAIEQPLQGAVARPYDVLALGGAPSASAPPDSLAAAVALLECDAAEQAGAMLRRVVAAERKAGLPHHRLLATALLAVAEHGESRWDEAATRAGRALAEALTLGQRWLLPCLEVVCAAPLAARGELDRALAHVAGARAT